MTDSLLGIALPDRLLWVVAVLTAVFFFSSLSLVGTVVMLRMRNLRRERRWAQLEARWEPAIIEVLVGERPESGLHDLVHRGERRYFVDFLIRYSTRLRGAERQAVLRLAQPYLSAIAGQLTHRNAEKRARAVRTLGELDVETWTPHIVSALGDASPLVAITAARSLARQRDPKLIKDLIDGLETFGLWNTQFLSSLLAEAGPEAGPILRSALEDPERPPRARALAAATLERLNDLAAAESAHVVLRTEQDTDLVVAALRLIRKVGRAEHLDTVRRLITASNPAVRGYAVSALAGIGTAEDAPQVRAALDDESSWVVMHAARGLEALGKLDVLREVARSEHPRAAAAREVLAGAGG